MSNAEDYIDRFFMNPMDGFEDLALGLVGTEIGFVGGATLKMNADGSQNYRFSYYNGSQNILVTSKDATSTRRSSTQPGRASR